MLTQRGIQVACTKPGEIAQGRLGAGEHDEVGSAQLLGMGHIAHAHFGQGGEGVEVGEVRDVRQAHDGDVEQGVCPARPLHGREAVLVVEVKGRVGHHTSHRHPHAPLKLVEAGLQKGHIAAELVDNASLDHAPLVVLKQGMRAYKLGKHAAAVDVAHKQHR